MPEFILDTSGEVKTDMLFPETIRERTFTTWRDLDSFTQGYIEALFFTENEPGTTRADRVTTRGTVRRTWEIGAREGRHKDMPGDYGFADLAPDTLAVIVADCAAFQDKTCLALAAAIEETEENPDFESRDYAAAGRDFWYTRNGHGVGFWETYRWPAPWRDDLDQAARTFGEVDSYLGDDGKVWL